MAFKQLMIFLTLRRALVLVVFELGARIVELLIDGC